MSFGGGIHRITLNLPHGSSEITNTHRLITVMLARQVVPTDSVQIIKPTENPPNAWVHDYVVDKIAREEVNYERREVKLRKAADLNRFCADRFKQYLSKKPIEFNVGTLTIENLEDLAGKYMQNFGSESSVIVLEPLNKYLKLVSIIDTQDAFRIYRTEDSSKGDLVELNPNKWVVGKYEDEREMFEKFRNMRTYNGAY